MLKKDLYEMGYEFHYFVDCAPKLNSVLIACKSSFEKKVFDELAEFKRHIVRLENEDSLIYGCYFPGLHLKKTIFEFLIVEIEKNKHKNIIIAGDLNTGKHYLDEAGATFYHSKYFDVFEEKGMVDAWRELNTEKREYSWFSNKGNGFRIDHFFINAALKSQIKHCSYSHRYREEKISDHSMMLLELM